MMNLPAGVHMIAAFGSKGQIGLDGELPWRDPADLAFFKEATMGCRLIVGFNTAQTIPELKGRDLIVDSPSLTPEKFLELMQADPQECIFVIGGAKTYRRWLPHVRHIFLTRIDYDGRADTFMPRLWEPTPDSVAADILYLKRRHETENV